jgi:hypothetical protein
MKALKRGIVPERDAIENILLRNWMIYLISGFKSHSRHADDHARCLGSQG